MATVTIANLIHRAEWDYDGLYWERGIPVCECGDDMSDGNRVTVHHVTPRSYKIVAVCQSCERAYPIVEGN